METRWWLRGIADSVSPLEPEHLGLVGKALQSPLAERYEPRRILLMAQFAREPGSNDPVGLGLAAEARGQLHRRAEQVVMVLDRLARIDADPNAERLGRVGIVSGKSALDIGRGAHRVRDVVERGHDTVAGVLDLAPAERLKPAPDERVMRPHQFKRRAVAKPRRHLGRTDEVGEHDGAQPRIHSGLRRALSRARIANAPE